MCCYIEKRLLFSLNLCVKCNSRCIPCLSSTWPQASMHICSTLSMYTPTILPWQMPWMLSEVLSSTWDLLFFFSFQHDGSISTCTKRLKPYHIWHPQIGVFSWVRWSINCIGSLDSRWIRHWIVQYIKHLVEAMKGLLSPLDSSSHHCCDFDVGDGCLQPQSAVLMVWGGAWNANGSTLLQRLPMSHNHLHSLMTRGRIEQNLSGQSV